MKRLEEGLGYVFEFESEGTYKDFVGFEINYNYWYVLIKNPFLLARL